MSGERPDVFPDWEQHRLTDDPHVRRTFAGVPAPVVAIAAMVGEEPAVMVATSFSAGVSHAPPMCMVAVQEASSTWQRLRSADRIGVSVLGRRHGDVVHRLASRDAAHRLDDVEWTRLPSGAITVYDSPVWLECEVVAEHPAGDHTIVVVQVHGSSFLEGHPPLIHYEKVFGTFSASDPG